MSETALDGAFLGQLRASLDAMAADVAQTLAGLGLTEYRPRYSAVIRIVAADGPSTIRHITERMNTTHSAGSQTVSDMASRGLVELRAGADARQRVVHLTRKAQRLRPLLDAEWTATAAALRELSSELSTPLEVIARELSEALQRRTFHDRIAAHLPDDARG
ncbi:MAG TPA: MarR family winged helix-turn-helix transcriptional regulator [Jatrophihabitantaceae bacterium]|jgi:DNA-binding MarR family transcriptional regulator|nr:MarR family winged helix-turn-helix transcriptional regulator [Jatrophihabitantaceae bacterium]